MLKQLIDKLAIESPAKAKSGLSEAELEYLYNIGAKSFQVCDYAKATPIFQLLSTVDPTNDLYVKGLAGCFQANGDYLNAMLAYKFAYILDMKENLDCLYYHGVCLFKCGNYEHAKQAFNSFSHQAAMIADTNKMLQRAKLYLETIERETNKN